MIWGEDLICLLIIHRETDVFMYVYTLPQDICPYGSTHMQQKTKFKVLSKIISYTALTIARHYFYNYIASQKSIISMKRGTEAVLQKKASYKAMCMV